jgi:hypothetical protein
MQIIESSRESFAADQKTLIDKKRIYQSNLHTFPENMTAALFGFPKIDLSKYDIVTSEETESAFKTKNAAPIKLR